MFAVYDGHGRSGHCAASFAKKKLPQILAKYIRQSRVKSHMSELKAQGKSTKGAWIPQEWPLLEKDALEECCRKAFLETNQAMHSEKSVRRVVVLALLLKSAHQCSLSQCPYDILLLVR